MEEISRITKIHSLVIRHTNPKSINLKKKTSMLTKEMRLWVPEPRKAWF